MDHKEAVAELRRRIKARCRGHGIKPVRVVMGQGTAWGNVRVWSANRGEMFSSEERAVLGELGILAGGNCGILFHRDVYRIIEGAVNGRKGEA